MSSVWNTAQSLLLGEAGQQTCQSLGEDLNEGNTADVSAAQLTAETFMGGLSAASAPLTSIVSISGNLASVMKRTATASSPAAKITSMAKHAIHTKKKDLQAYVSSIPSTNSINETFYYQSPSGSFDTNYSSSDGNFVTDNQNNITFTEDNSDCFSNSIINNTVASNVTISSNDIKVESNIDDIGDNTETVSFEDKFRGVVEKRRGRGFLHNIGGRNALNNKSKLVRVSNSAALNQMGCDDDEDCEPIDVCGDVDMQCDLNSLNTDMDETIDQRVGRPRGGLGGGSNGRGRGRPRGRGAGRGRGRGYLPPAVAEGLARHQAVQQKVYKIKYKQLKKLARSLVLENAALCDQVADVQQKIILTGEERRFLLRRLHSAMQSAVHIKDNPFQQLEAPAWHLLEGSTDAASAGAPATTTAERLDRANRRPRGQHTGRSSNSRSNTKSKRLCPPITLDSAGRPIFPICLGPLTIHSLGEIVYERPSYHRGHVIFPVGFCSSRTYASVKQPTQPATYTCKILDAGVAPRFEVVCEDPESGKERVFGGTSPSDCHSQVVAAINAAPHMPQGILVDSPDSNSTSDRGLRFFGLSHPSVQNVLQACPGARKCHNYHWIKFEVCRSEGQVEKVLEAERETGLCHETLLRNIRFASQDHLL